MLFANSDRSTLLNTVLENLEKAGDEFFLLAGAKYKSLIGFGIVSMGASSSTDEYESLPVCFRG
jgi:hypothetical protein